MIETKETSTMKTITHLELKPKPVRRKGMVYAGYTDGNYSAVVTPGASIRIYGDQTNSINPRAFDRVFKVGDVAEYHSFNIKFNGTIVAIGPTTVTVKHYEHSKEVSRMCLYDFVRHNWNFDLAKSEAHNAAELQCL
jgi:hypothetical protein